MKRISELRPGQGWRTGGNRRLWLAAFLLFFFSGAAALAGEKAASTSAKASVADRAEAAAARLAKAAPKAQYGISAVDLATAKTLIAIDADTPLIPASNMKVVTSALALANLGGEFQFTTTLYAMGKDLVVVGDYDPTLGDPVIAAELKKDIYWQLDPMAAALKKKMDKVEGDLLIVAPDHAYRHEDWPKDQYAKWYEAPVAPLNFNNNCLDVTYDVSGKTVTPVLSPDSKFFDVTCKVTLGKSNLWLLKSNEDDSAMTLTGTTVKDSQSPPTSINHPPLFFGRVLADRIVKAGVALGGNIRCIDPKDFDKAKATPIAQIQTPLATAMARANKRSLNSTAECIFIRACGYWDVGSKKAGETLTKMYGLDARSFTISDGSGLSRNDKITPAGLTTLLTALASRKDGKVFIDSLPISGTDGTLEKRMKTEAYKGRVLAKTGYINGVSCLSGYALGAGGKPAIAFSVMVNGVSGPGDAKVLEDTVAEILVDSLPKKE